VAPQHSESFEQVRQVDVPIAGPNVGEDLVWLGTSAVVRTERLPFGTVRLRGVLGPLAKNQHALSASKHELLSGYAMLHPARGYL